MGEEFSIKESVDTYTEGITSEELSLRPVMLQLVGDVRGNTVLDIGCGNGRYSQMFAQNGANVIATDASTHQIELAKQKHSHQHIRYSVGDLSAESLPAASADVVFANLVIPSLGGTDKLDTLFEIARQALKPGGKFVVSALHPLLYVSSDADMWDKATDFKPENYFTEGTQYHAEALTNAGNEMRFNESHFSLTRISEAMQKSGFVIRKIIESRQVPEKQMLLPKYVAFECVLAS
ncbi:class I SAM-dependent methyltransferase [Candidatus Kaiserbacteria bacterium]|nr:class I SAM-dependent methyltransferase [Candidatus Kaiserbacteria bacterium]